MTNEPIRVLYFIAYPQRMAGANRSLMELISNLPDFVSPVVLSVGQGRATAAYESMGIPVFVLQPGNRLNTYGKSLLYLHKTDYVKLFFMDYLPYTLHVIRLIRGLKVDFLHTNDPRGTVLIGLAALLCRKKIVAHLRGEKPFGGPFWRVFESIPFTIVCVAKALLSCLSVHAKQKSVVVYNGISHVSLDGFQLLWEKVLRDPDVAVIVCMASLIPSKGIHHLLDAIAELNGAGLYNQLMCICIGDFYPEYEDYQEWLLNKQRTNALFNVFFTGWQKDPYSFYRIADISVLPSISHELLDIGGKKIQVCGTEGLPRTHLEAMWFRLPVISTHIAGVGEQIEDGRNGFLVPPSDSHAMAQKIKKLIDDPNMRRRMGEEGRKMVQERFSTRAYVDGIMRVYSRCIKNS